MRTAITLAALSLVACSSQQASPDAGAEAGLPDARVDTRIDSRADATRRSATYPLSTVVPSDDLSDLAPLAAMIGQAEVVGLGEFHTAGGELQMRTRVIEYLVTSQKFRLLAFESERTPVGLYTEKYLQSCTGTAEDAVAINPIWWEESTPALLRWLCQWNTAHPTDKVHAIGVDIHQPWYDFPTVKAYLDNVAPAEAAKLPNTVYLCLGAKYASQDEFFADPTNVAYYDADGVHIVPQADHDACQTGTTAALAYLDAHRTELIASSEHDFELARLALVGLQAYDTTIYKLSRAILDNAPRDQAMFDVLRTIRRLDYPGARTMVWAHNGHIQQHSDEVLKNQWTGVKSLGTLLAVDLNGKYVAIGQVAATTHINWMWGAETLKAPTGSLELLLDGLGKPLLLVDMQLATAGSAPLVDLAKTYRVGVDPSYPSAVPARSFDVLIFQHECPGPKYFKNPPWFKGY
jgi:erythromycin esterase